MAIILKSTKKNHSLLQYYHSVIKVSMVLVLQEGDHDIIGSKSLLRMIAVESRVAAEASKTRNKRKRNTISECPKLPAK
jgi:hypothetical protein